jgi:hypothetical protein
MAAIILDDTGVAEVRSAIEILRRDFKVPEDKVMSWLLGTLLLVVTSPPGDP